MESSIITINYGAHDVLQEQTVLNAEDSPTDAVWCL